MKILYTSLIVIIALEFIIAAPTRKPKFLSTDDDNVNPLEVLGYMKKYGYLPKTSSDDKIENVFSSESIIDAIKEVQRFGALRQTGKIDNDTLKLMITPRCGVSDKHQATSANSFSSSGKRRTKRFAIGSEGWKKRTITYYIANWSPKIGEEHVAREMQKAFDTWAGYARLKFIRVGNPNADIIVAFGRGHHGDGYPFDGPGNTLAHAFYPYEMSSLGGDIHFDDDENWKLKLDGPFDDGVDFLTVAIHELGHSLGLAHSPDPQSIMFPYFKGYNPNGAQLGYDDILAMYQLYITRDIPEDDIYSPNVPHFIPGEREEKGEDKDNEEEEEEEESDNDNEVTDEDEEDNSTIKTPTFEGDYDTVDNHRAKFGTSSPNIGTTNTKYGNFQSAFVIDKNTPKLTTTTTTPAPKPKIDICTGSYDAISVIRGELFVFKGNMVWRLKEPGQIERGYPVPITQMFWQLPKNISHVDAIYERPTDGNIVIFSGTQVWITDGDKLIEKKSLTAFGLPNYLAKIDAIMVWGKNQKTYIFSGDKYWKYDEYAQQTDAGYPDKIRVRWRGVPTPIDTVFTNTDGITYFFKNNQFWRFDNILIKTEERYPLSAPQLWLECQDEAQDY